MIKRNYRTELKAMTKDQLAEWIIEKTDLMMQVGDTGGNTPLLTKIVYAKSLLKKHTRDDLPT